MTVRELITSLLDQPLDSEIFVEVNGNLEYPINDVTSIGSYRSGRVLIQIEVEEGDEA